MAETSASPDVDPGSSSSSSEEDAEQWLTRQEAIEFSGLNARSFQRREDSGQIKRHKRPQGVRYNRSELLELDDGSNATANQARIFVTIKELLDLSLSHNRDFGKMIGHMVEGPAKLLQESLRDEIKALRAECADLRTKYTDALDVVDKARTDLLARELEATKAKASEARKEDAWNLVMKMLPILGEQVAGTHMVEKLFSKLTPAQVQVMLEADNGFFTPEQIAVFKDAWEKFEKAREKKKKVEADRAAKEAEKKGTSASAKPNGAGREPPPDADVIMDRKPPAPETPPTPPAPEGAPS